MKDCVFCKIAESKIKVERIYENEIFFSIFDANPITKGHSLVISKKHFENIIDLPDTLGSELIDCIKKTSLILMKKFNCDGLNVIQNNFESAGQVVKHLHLHLIPRKKNDDLKNKLIFA